MAQDGGPVLGTGGGKWGPALRWKRPPHAHAGIETWSTTIVVPGIGRAVRGRRTQAVIDLLVVETGEGFVWRVTTEPDLSAYLPIDQRMHQGTALTSGEAKSEAVRAAHQLAKDLAGRRSESQNHPPIGPMQWPGTFVPKAPAEEVTIVEIEEVPTQNPAPPSYKASHWGIKSTKSTVLNVPDPRVNAPQGLIQLGVLVSIVYLTEKGGDGELTEYEHKFEKTHPRLAYGSKDGKLYIAGGSYRVSSRGIVG